MGGPLPEGRPRFATTGSRGPVPPGHRAERQRPFLAASLLPPIRAARLGETPRRQNFIESSARQAADGPDPADKTLEDTLEDALALPRQAAPGKAAVRKSRMPRGDDRIQPRLEKHGVMSGLFTLPVLVGSILGLIAFRFFCSIVDD